MKMNHHDFTIAYNQNYVHYLKAVHLFLNEIYHKTLFNQDEKNSLDYFEIKKLKQIEEVWIKHEVNHCLKTYDCNQTIYDAKIIYHALKSHPAYNHPLFDFLCTHANYAHLQQYILNESVLNLEFFDYLTLSLVGAKDEAKAEIVANLWDKAGRGKIQYFQCNLFKKLMRQMDLQYERELIIENMSWEGLAGINLFSYFALYPFNKMKYFGLLVATEMLDPLHYTKLIKGLDRILSSYDIDYQYYLEQKTTHIDQAHGWIQKVVLPELLSKKENTKEFWLGFYMRLESVYRYYNKLLHFFTTKKAA